LRTNAGEIRREKAERGPGPKLVVFRLEILAKRGYNQGALEKVVFKCFDISSPLMSKGG
jgi:hypothetical protein